MNKPIFYGLNIYGITKHLPKDCAKIRYFYIHGTLEKTNGYDLVCGNAAAISLCTTSHLKVVEVILTNGEKYNALLGTWITNIGMSGYIVSLDDEKGIQDMLINMNRNTIHLIHFETELINLGYNDLFEKIKNNNFFTKII